MISGDAPPKSPGRIPMLAATKQETGMRSWDTLSTPEDAIDRFVRVLDGRGGRVDAQNSIIEAHFGSRLAIRMGGILLAKGQLPYHVRLTVVPGIDAVTTVLAAVADDCGRLTRCGGLTPMYQQQFTELLDVLQQAVAEVPVNRT
jgi:hypothetical protein